MCKIFQNVTQLLDSCRIKTICRFIKNKKFRPVKYSLCNTKTLTHSKGIFSDLVVDTVFQSDNFNNFIYSFLINIASHSCILSEILHTGHILVKLRIFNNSANLCHCRFKILPDTLSIYQNIPVIKPKMTYCYFYGCSLSCTVRTEKSENLSGISFKGNVMQYLLFAEIFVKMFYSECCCHCAFPPSPPSAEVMLQLFQPYDSVPAIFHLPPF